MTVHSSCYTITIKIWEVIFFFIQIGGQKQPKHFLPFPLLHESHINSQFMDVRIINFTQNFKLKFFCASFDHNFYIQ